MSLLHKTVAAEGMTRSRCWLQIHNQLASDTLHDLDLDNGTQV